MQSKFVIGIDGGTQSSKVSIFDLDGGLVCSGSKRLRPMNMPKPGVAEHPEDDVWDSIAIACKRAMEVFPYQHDSILAVGVCTIRCCQVALTEQGKLASPILNWMDQRVGLPYSWPDDNVRYLTTSSGYVSFRLTDKKRDTVANYEGMWPLDKVGWCWSKDDGQFKATQLKRENLFELVMPGEPLGRVTERAARETGLPAGLPVIATANDKAVEALGAGLNAGKTGDHQALISLGTYVGGMVNGMHHIDDAKHYFTNLACIPGRYLYESGGVRHGMGTISWFLDLLGDSLVEEARKLELSVEDMLNEEASLVCAGSEGLITVPEWLAPYNQPFKRGAMLGFHPGHTRAHIYRSILEAIALTMKNHLENLVDELDFQLNQVLVSGGGSRSDLFMQIFADVLAVPTVRNQVYDAAGLGSAICAAVASGAYNSFDEAMDGMIKPGDRFEPDIQNAHFYEKLNVEIFKDVTASTDPLFQDSYQLNEHH